MIERLLTAFEKEEHVFTRKFDLKIKKKVIVGNTDNNCNRHIHDYIELSQ